MYEITPIPGNKVMDGVESPTTAYRFSHAVARWNMGNPERRATFEVYPSREDAQPPIDAPDAKPGEIYTRLSYPAGAFAVIQSIEMALTPINTAEAE